ncbi:peptidase U32 family protein, partial [Pseudomonas sp. BJa3]
LMKEQFGIQRVVLPRVLTLAEIARICANVSVEVEVFGFGSLCVMAEGRCLLSSYATGDSPNNKGVCSPASAVRWVEQDGRLDARLN